MINKSTLGVFALVIVFSGAGCSLSDLAVGPTYEAPEVIVEHDIPLDSSIRSMQDSEELIIPRWSELFQDEILTSLLLRLEKRNYDLKKLRSRIQEARHLKNTSRIELLPQIVTEGSYTKSKRNAFANGFGDGVIRTELYSAGFDATWEIDLLGGRRREILANTAIEEQNALLLEDALLTLKGEFVEALNDYLQSIDQLEVLENTVERQEAILDLVRNRFEEGSSNEIDLNRSRALLHEAKALLAPARIAQAEAYHRMNVLLGEEPLQFKLKLPETIDVSPFEIVGNAKSILAGRPDVRAAERALAAQFHRIGAESADLYPRIFFNGSIDLQASADNFGNKQESWSFGPSMRWAFLDSFRQLQEVYAQEERSKQSRADFQLTLLRAIEEVSNSVISMKNRRSALIDLNQAQESSSKAAELTRARYEVGFSDFEEVLDAEREFLATRLTFINGRKAYISSVIALKKSLGKPE